MTSPILTRRTALFAFAAFLTVSAQPVKRPNFSGTWKLNKEKSVYGKIPLPDDYTMEIKHQGSALDFVATLKNPFGEHKSESKLKTDGTENTTGQGRLLTKSTISWQGAVMVMKTFTVITLGDQKQETSGEERWELSADRKTLTMAASMKGARGEVAVKRVLDKIAE